MRFSPVAKFYILCSYNNQFMLPFGESIKNIILSSLTDLGHECEFSYCNRLVAPREKKYIMIFIMPPEKFLREILRTKLNVAQHKLVFWNLEPFTPLPKSKKIPTNKCELNFLYINNINNMADLWLYNKVQLESFPGATLVIPGFHECILPEKYLLDKVRKPRFIFVGHLTHRREVFLKGVVQKMQGLKGTKCKYHVFNHRSFAPINLQTVQMSRYPAGIDLHATDLYLDHVNWHRIMLYAASKNVIFTENDLSEYGFVDREDYFMLHGLTNSIDNIAFAINSKNKDKTQQITDNAYNKIRNNFYMPNIIAEAIKKL